MEALATLIFPKLAVPPVAPRDTDELLVVILIIPLTIGDSAAVVTTPLPDVVEELVSTDKLPLIDNALEELEPKDTEPLDVTETLPNIPPVPDETLVVYTLVVFVVVTVIPPAPPARTSVGVTLVPVIDTTLPVIVAVVFVPPATITLFKVTEPLEAVAVKPLIVIDDPEP